MESVRADEMLKQVISQATKDQPRVYNPESKFQDRTLWSYFVHTFESVIWLSLQGHLDHLIFVAKPIFWATCCLMTSRFVETSPVNYALNSLCTTIQDSPSQAHLLSCHLYCFQWRCVTLIIPGIITSSSGIIHNIKSECFRLRLLKGTYCIYLVYLDYFC